MAGYSRVYLPQNRITRKSGEHSRGRNSMKCALKYVFGISLILTLGYALAWAQATAQVSGTVTDQSGARLPGAEVTATQTETGLVRTVVTNETGSYGLPSLPTGPYTLGVSMPGFRTLE